MKQYACVNVGDHKDIGNTIDEWQEKGWRLHTYVCAGHGMPVVQHYLLFEKGERSPIAGAVLPRHRYR